MEQIIKQKLTEIGEDYEALKPFMREHLYKVESFIQNKQKGQAGALTALRDSEYNVSEVAKSLDYSRTTLYNHNQLLKKYIEYSLELDSKNNPIRIAEEIKVSKQKLQEQVNLMMNRDVDFELLKHENSVLVNTLKEKDREIERLKNRIQELSSDLHKERSRQSKNTEVIKFNKNS